MSEEILRKVANSLQSYVNSAVFSANSTVIDKQIRLSLYETMKNVCDKRITLSKNDRPGISIGGCFTLGAAFLLLNFINFTEIRVLTSLIGAGLFVGGFSLIKQRMDGNKEINLLKEIKRTFGVSAGSEVTVELGECTKDTDQNIYKNAIAVPIIIKYKGNIERVMVTIGLNEEQGSAEKPQDVSFLNEQPEPLPQPGYTENLGQ
jgi:hypothetical protein